ncbi:MAG TPA: tetratricopeptide repeat protein [Flavobacteriaceae bacterium]|nr:tetratricopeptide repeat protein [Flavobacteriaceae bacterium]
MLFSLVGFGLLAQDQSDSLQKALQNSNGTERAELLLKISSYTRQADVKKAIGQAGEALQIAQRIEDRSLQAQSYAKLGFYHSMIDRDTTALENFLSALKINRQLGNRLAEAEVLHSLGRFYLNQENYTRSLDYFFQALRIRQEMGNKNETANTLSYIGDLYRERGETEQAASFFKKAVILAEETNNLREISISGVKLGNMLHQLGKFEEATRYFELALNAAKEMNSVHAQAGILLVMSSAYQDENLYDRAFGLNQELLEIAKLQNNKILLGRGYENLAGIYTEKGELERANEYYIKANQFYKEIQFPTLPVTHKLMRNLIEQNKADKAIKIGEAALKETKETAAMQDRGNLIETLIGAYKKQEKPIKALGLQEKLITLNKQIFDTEKAEQIAEMQTRFETEQKEREILLLEKESEKATLMRNGLIIGMFLLAVIAFLIYNRQRLKIKKNKTNLENTRLRQKQLKQDLEFKNRQLTTLSLNMVQKNEVMKELKQRITEMRNQPGTSPNKVSASLIRLVDYSFNLDKDWEEFRLYFEEVHSGFFDLLKKRYPDLTTNELRLSALVKLNLTIKEISTILNISPDSVKTARYRLRKKLGLETEDNLSEFLGLIDKASVSAS